MNNEVKKVTDWIIEKVKDWLKWYMPETVLAIVIILMILVIVLPIRSCVKAVEEPCGYATIVDRSYTPNTQQTRTGTTIDSDGDPVIYTYTVGEREKMEFVVQFGDGNYEKFEVDVNTFYTYDIGDEVACYQRVGKRGKVWHRTVR